MSRARYLLLATTVFSLASRPLASSERVAEAAAATVFVRVIGKIGIVVDASWTEQQERDVELGTGSGFVFTPYGQVLTNQHVVSGGTYHERVGSHDVTLHLTVERIEVVLPSPGTEDSPRRFEASIEASDPDVDLAVLSVNGAELPYLALGDSDAADPGETVSVYGFPFGRKVEVGRTELPDIVPTVSVSRGAVSAVRADDAGNTAFLQTTATVNPGNSGGPMVDSEGFVLGVVRLKLRGGDGIGFAIPVNAVKDFLEVHGYGGLLPVERLRLGGEQNLERKGLRLRLPESMEDRSTTRLTVFSDPADASIGFASDRIATPWDLPKLEETLLSGSGELGWFRATTAKKSRVLSGGRLIVGSATGQDVRNGIDAKIEYALFDGGDRGKEKVVVRYTGTAEAVAYNRSVLLESLRSVEVAPLRTAPVMTAHSPDRMAWVAKALPEPGAPSVLMPYGSSSRWEDEVSAPVPCPGLPPVDSALASSPEGDFTVSLRAGWWRAGPDAAEAVAACGGRRTTDAGASGAGGNSYAYRVDWLGQGYVVSGAFETVGDGLLQREVVSPIETEGYVRELERRFVAGSSRIRR
jgi:Trypsin-like peptidase domain